ncbi:unnamed protein product, partial [Closterium sp. Naga37s-1]
GGYNLKAGPGSTIHLMKFDMGGAAAVLGAANAIAAIQHQGVQFVAEGLPWAHLDIAGPVWSEKKGRGTGFGASLLYHWVASHSP